MIRTHSEKFEAGEGESEEEGHVRKRRAQIMFNLRSLKTKRYQNQRTVNVLSTNVSRAWAKI